MQKYGDIVRVDVVDTYGDLSLKTLKMFSTLPSKIDADFYFKVDDDVAVNLDAMAAYLKDRRSQGNLYLVRGCLVSQCEICSLISGSGRIMCLIPPATCMEALHQLKSCRSACTMHQCVRRQDNLPACCQVIAQLLQLHQICHLSRAGSCACAI